MTPQEQQQNLIRTVNGWTIPTLREQYLKQSAQLDQMITRAEQFRLMLVSLSGQVWLTAEQAIEIQVALSKASDGAATRELLALSTAIHDMQRRNPQHDPNPAELPEAGASHEVASGADGDGVLRESEPVIVSSQSLTTDAVPVATGAEGVAGG